MKLTYLLISFLSLSSLLQAQVSKTVDVTTAGSLSRLLDHDELTTITDLTLTGTIDARDFLILRDSMPNLENVDLSTVAIHAYDGVIAPETFSYYYQKDEIPAFAFSDGYFDHWNTRLKSIELPASTAIIGPYAFYGCSSLTTIRLPSLVNTIYFGAFNYCTGLRSIYCDRPTPAEIIWYDWDYNEPFDNVDKDLCSLYVPYGKKELYAATPSWSQFKTIIAMHGFMLSVTSIVLPSNEDSTITVDVLADSEWAATSDQSWLTLSQQAANGDQTITFTAGENTLTTSRVAAVTFSCTGVANQTITVRQAGIARTVEVTPGGLLAALTHEERNGLMNLSLTGTIDARDFKILRDSMPVLTTVDLSKVTIAAYSGFDGTVYSYGRDGIDYPVNEIPNQAFLEVSGLIQIALPATAVSIGDQAFSNCTGLASVDLPDALMNIGEGAFSGCWALTSIAIPSSVKTIGSNAFNSCTGLTSLYVHSTIPVDLSHSPDVFSGVYKGSCILMVPYQSKARYAKANQWMNFKNIQEAAIGIALETNQMNYDAAEQSFLLEIMGNVDWTVKVSQSWIAVDKLSGSGDQSLTVTLQANTGTLGRQGLVTVTTLSGNDAQSVTITQEGYPKTITLTPGGLSSSLSKEEFQGIYHLILEGTMDARDFKTIRDEMPLLNFLDLSQITIIAYSGQEGTNSKSGIPHVYYPANEIPAYAFRSQNNTVINDRLKTIVLPLTLNVIGENAFMDCLELTSINVPPSVTNIKKNAFFRCIGLQTVSLPPSVTTIGSFAFYYCTALQSIYSQAAIPPAIADYARAFSGCDTINCKLYVPVGTRKLYANANEWKDFKNIIEITTSTDDLELNKATFVCYPNPFTQQIGLDIANHSHKEVSVDIFTMTGQRIRTLARARKEAKITCTWDGTNEQGQQVPNGMYLITVNKQTMKVLKK